MNYSSSCLKAFIVAVLFATLVNKSAAQAWVAHHGLPAIQYQANFNQLNQQGYRLKCVTFYGIGNSEHYADLWVKEPGPAWEARHELSSAAYQKTFDDMAKQGFRLTWISGHETNGEDRYEAIWEKSPGPPWQARHGLTAVQYQKTFDDLIKQGYRLAQVSGYSSHTEARYAAIFEKSSGPAWQARHGMTSSQYQQQFNDLTKQGYRLVDVSGYNGGGEARYAAIFDKSSGPAWQARHGMTSSQYQSDFDDFAKQGFRLKEVSGYNVGGTDYYAAIWEKLSAPLPTNLLTNPGFEILHVGAMPGKPMVYPGCKQPGFSPGADWTTWMNSCYWDPSSHTLTTELVPSTAPNGSHYMIHVVTDGRDNGIVQSALWSAPKTKSSAWVFVNKGCVGIGTGNGGNTNPNDATTCETGKWIHLQAPNGVSPANEFIIYSVAVDGVPDSLKGADFYADNAEVVSVP